MAAILGSLASSLCGMSVPCAARPMSLSELEELAAGYDMSIDGAPAGGMVALGWKRRVQVVDVKGGGVVADLGPGFGPAWAPDSQHLVFYSKRSGTLQLWLWSRRTGRVSALTHDAGGLDMDTSLRVMGRPLDVFRVTWSPDGRHVAFASRERHWPVVPALERKVDPGIASGPIVLTTETPSALTLRGILVDPGEVSGVFYSDDGATVRSRSGENTETQIREIDIATGAERPLTRGTSSHFDPTWSADGKFIACISAPGAGVAVDARETQVSVVVARTGLLHDVTSGPGLKSSLVWETPSDVITFMRSRSTFAWPALYAVDVDAGHKPSRVELLDRSIFKRLWQRKVKAFVVQYKDGVTGPLARIPLHSTPRILTSGSYPVDVADFTTLGDGSIAWIQLDPVNLWTLRFLRAGMRESSTVMRLTRMPRQGEIGRVEVLKWRDRRGDEHAGTVLLPPGFSAGGRYPLIVDAYPLIEGADWTDPMFGNYAWASAGYVVFRPSPRAPHVWMNPWTTEASSEVAKGPAGWTITMDDVMSGVQKLISTGVVDPDRMCLYGFSNGGGVVDDLVTRVHRFRCAVAVAPALSDWVRPFLLEGSDWVSAFDDGKGLDEGLSDYITLSAVYHLSSVHTPMLLADGDEDGGFLLDAVEMYNRLRELGRPVTLVRYPHQEHGFTGAALEDFWSREMAFFARYLNPHRGRDGMAGVGGRDGCSGCSTGNP